MTAPTLPDTLTRLAELLPRRAPVELDGFGNRHFYAWQDAAPGQTGHFAHVYVQSRFHELLSPHGARMLRAALEEECRLRGWEWSAGEVKATAERPPEPWAKVGLGPTIFADTPAHALALALVQALEEGA